jgi:hypothetical protein
MKSKFKFFRGYVGTLDLMDGQTATTASLYYPRLDSNNEMERWYAERDLQTVSQEQYNLNRDMLATEQSVRFAQQRRESRMLELREIEENANRVFFPRTRVTTVNPKWWMKIKMFFQKLSLYSDQVVPITVIATTITFIVILILSKILSIW